MAVKSIKRPIPMRATFCTKTDCTCHAYYYTGLGGQTARCVYCGCFLTPEPGPLQLLLEAGGRIK